MEGMKFVFPMTIITSNNNYSRDVSTVSFKSNTCEKNRAPHKKTTYCERKKSAVVSRTVLVRKFRTRLFPRFASLSHQS